MEITEQRKKKDRRWIYSFNLRKKKLDNLPIIFASRVRGRINFIEINVSLISDYYPINKLIILKRKKKKD